MFSCLSKEEVTKYSISEDILEVRDALAHGRLVAPDPPELPYALWNFGQPSDGQVEVRFCEVLTAEWLEQTRIAIYDAQGEGFCLFQVARIPGSFVT
jgi:hypothetical protein